MNSDRFHRRPFLSKSRGGATPRYDLATRPPAADGCALAAAPVALRMAARARAARPSTSSVRAHTLASVAAQPHWPPSPSFKFVKGAQRAVPAAFDALTFAVLEFSLRKLIALGRPTPLHSLRKHRHSHHARRPSWLLLGGSDHCGRTDRCIRTGVFEDGTVGCARARTTRYILPHPDPVPWRRALLS